MSEAVQEFVLEQRLGFHATVSPEGRPNLSPKGTTTVFNAEHLCFADIHSPQTTLNLKSNSSIEVNVVDPILRRGYRFRGAGTVHSGGAVFRRGIEVLAERDYDTQRHRIHAIVLIHLDAIEELRSPAYDGGASEAEVARVWRARMLTRLRG